MNINGARMQGSYASSGKQLHADRAISQQTGNSSILDNTRSYGDSLRAQRQNAKDTSLELKKLRYQFKSISTKILRSKTSLAARQVAGQARREVLRLKRAKQSQNSEYDAEELEAAITHAQAMERVAKKKARHLEEEEMAKASGGMCADTEVKEKEASPEEQGAEAERAEAALSSDGVQGDALSDMEELTSEVLDEFSQSMQEMLEEMGFGELNDSLLAIWGEMDPADLKLMKIKHRNKEMKEIVKADAEYLKAVFDQMEKEKDGAVLQSGGSVSFGNMGSAMPGGIASSLSAVTGLPVSEPVINVTL